MPLIYSDLKKILIDQNHVETGGEGSVYVYGDKAYKIYLNPTEEKSKQSISAIAYFNSKPGLSKQVAHPSDFIVKSKTDHMAIGLVMPAVFGKTLCEFCTTAYQRDLNVSASDLIDLSNNMVDLQKNIHMNGFAIVDGNELNWLIESKSNKHTPYLIDTDSWQWPGHNATAIMPSIRDPLVANNAFDQKSDWFALAVGLFQLWTGIHPYKGVHPKYKPNQFLDRIRDKVSVFSPDVRLPPPSVPRFDNIPAGLKDWFKSVFVSDVREAPALLTLLPGKNLQTKLTVLQSYAGSLKIEQWFDYAGFELLKILKSTNTYFLLRDRVLNTLNLLNVGTRKIVKLDATVSTKVLKSLSISPKALTVVSHATRDLLVFLTPCDTSCDYKVECYDISNEKSISATLQVPVNSTLWTSHNRLFVVTQNSTHISEISIENRFIGYLSKWNVLTSSALFGYQVIIQDLMGMPFVSVATKDSGIIHAKAPFLKGFSVLSAGCVDEKNVLICVKDKKTGLDLQFNCSLDPKTLDIFEKSDLSSISTNTVDGALLLDKTTSSLSYNTLPSGAMATLLNSSIILMKQSSLKEVPVDPSVLRDYSDLISCANGLFMYNDTNLRKISMT